MRYFFVKYKILSGVLILTVLYSINSTIALLSFCIFFQIGATLEILKQIKLSKKLNKEESVPGHLIEVRKILGNEYDVHNYEGIIEFSLPNSASKYCVKHKFSSLFKPDILKKYKVCVDQQNPGNSIVLDSLNGYWKFSISMLLMIAIALFVLDLFLLKQL